MIGSKSKFCFSNQRILSMKWGSSFAWVFYKSPMGLKFPFFIWLNESSTDICLFTSDWSVRSMKLTFSLLHQFLFSECPEECREAVSSLMFAAARFSDLPELRDLRNIFQEKYGNYVEHFVNKEVILDWSTWNTKLIIP